VNNNHELRIDVVFRLTYVGSADDEKCDQVLDEISLGPINEGMSKFQLEVSCSNLKNDFENHERSFFFHR
jgi:hypothetical protein